MTTSLAKRPATYDDLLAVPPPLVAELVFGALETHPRPSPRHAAASSNLGAELTGLFQRGRGGPGGWIFLDEPELHLGAHVVVPDIAGWRAERLAALPDTPYLTIAPDWVCEVLSPATERLDRGAKRQVYAEAGVSHLWLVDPRARLLEAFSLRDGAWTLVATAENDDEVRVAPFDAAAFSLGHLWPFDPPTSPPSSPT
jgi:Uma2 family endonuclease